MKCPICNGKGKISHIQRVSTNNTEVIVMTETPCPRCQGGMSIRRALPKGGRMDNIRKSRQHGH